jgi:subtilisin family serine protease
MLNNLAALDAVIDEARVLSRSSRLIVVKRPTVELQSFAIAALKRNPAVEYVEPNYMYRHMAIPNDPRLGDLWGLVNTGQSLVGGEAGVSGVDIGAERAWNIATGSEKIIVAVIDTGVDYTHPDLAANMWVNEAERAGQPGVDDDQNGVIDDVHGADFANNDGDPMDDNGHGTHVAGTIGAVGDDGAGVVGVNWRVKIMAGKFLQADGGGDLKAAISAIQYAVNNGAKILNNSWGGGPHSRALEEVIQWAEQKGVLFVAAAGNHRGNNDEQPTYPASYNVPNVISVAAINNKGLLADFSCFGRRSVHLGAPGDGILSTVPGGKYRSFKGTSMATPHVVGVAALVWGHEPGLTAAEVRDRIISTARPLSSLKNKTRSGGTVDAYFALINQRPPPDPNDPDMWRKMAQNISTPHPYLDESALEWTIRVPGAKRLALYFPRFQTEKGYDQLTFIDENGQVVATWSGERSEEYGPVILGEAVTLRFKSDKTVVRYGFDITHVAYQPRRKIRDPKAVWDDLAKKRDSLR